MSSSFNPEDSWALVELYRWQHDELPGEHNKSKELDESVALVKMAEAIEKGCKEKDISLMPNPFAVCAILRYMSRKINRKEVPKAKEQISKTRRNNPCLCGSGLKYKNCCGL